MIWAKGKGRVVWGALFIGLLLSFSLSGTQEKVKEMSAGMKNVQKEQTAELNNSETPEIASDVQVDDLADEYVYECPPTLKLIMQFLQDEKQEKVAQKMSQKERERRAKIHKIFLKFLNSHGCRSSLEQTL